MRALTGGVHQPSPVSPTSWQAGQAPWRDGHPHYPVLYRSPASAPEARQTHDRTQAWLISECTLTPYKRTKQSLMIAVSAPSGEVCLEVIMLASPAV